MSNVGFSINTNDSTYNLTDLYATNLLDSSNINSTSFQEELLKLLRGAHTKPLTFDEIVRNVLIIISYSLIVVVSLCGNLLVVKVIVLGKRKMCTTTNILIASLAFSDIVMTAFNIPFNIARLLSNSWPFGAFLCVSVPFVQVWCVYVSTFTMTVIAFYRWLILRRNTSVTKSLSSVKLTLIIGSVWLFAAILSIPHSIFNETIVIPTIKELVRCHPIYPESDFNIPLLLSVEAFTTQYLIPLSVTLILYILIGLVISKQGKQSVKSRVSRSDAIRRRIIMLVLVVAAFAVCWLPLNLYHLLVDFQLISRNPKLFIACHWFAMSSVCYNPFIYCYLNSSFRNGAKKLLKFMKCRGKQSHIEYNGDEQTAVSNVNRIEMKTIK